MLGGAQGLCESDGFCAFPDPGCLSGERYEPNAGNGMGGQCVAPGAGVDAAIDGLPAPDAFVACGSVGMACCAGGNACVPNAYCASGTCQQCVVDIAFGQTHGCAIEHDGTVWCTGANDRGQLGTGVLGGVNENLWQQVRDSSNALINDATKIVAGSEHTCVLRAGGQVWCWGKNDDGQIGNGSTISSGVPAATAATYTSNSMPVTNMIAIGMVHDATFAVDNAGGIWSWGDNANAQLGDGTTTSRSRASPVLVAAGGAAFTGAAAVSGDEDSHVCLRTTGNAIWCWGNNPHGQVGDNTIVQKTNPVHVFDAIEVAAGRDHTCAVKADNTVWCWGNAYKGRLGIGPGQGDQLVPVAVQASSAQLSFPGAVEITGGGVGCARMQDGSAYCWGVNTHGQTGTGIGTYWPLPVIHANGVPLANVTHIVAGYATTCAFLANGELLCWGKNTYGQLGDGTFASRNFPAPLTLSCAAVP